MITVDSDPEPLHQPASARLDAQFIASIAIARAAPGPNVLFVAVIG